MNMKDFNEGFLALCEMTDKTPSKPYTKFYYEAVKHLDVKEWEKSIAHVIQNRKYTNMPMPAEILEHAQGDPEDAAILAIQKLENAMREVGAYDSVKFDDPVLMVLVSGAEGGWPGLCQMPLDDWKFEKPRLIKAYKALAMRGVRGDIKHLAGISERANGEAFPEWEPTVHLIGDEGQIKMLSTEDEPKQLQGKIKEG